MNDEIKEILEDIDNKERYYVGTNGCLYQDLTKEELLLIKDYITNLQKENEKLKEIIENLTTMTVCGDNKQIKNTAQYKLDICKSRIDKAIKLIESYNMGKYNYTIPPIGIIDLLDILKGDDTNEER